MNHISFLQVQQSVDHLIDNVPGFVFAETFFSTQFLVQISVSAILEHHIDVLGVVKVAIEAYDVRVVKTPLNFEFSLHLAEKVELFEHMFENDFQGNWDSRRSLHCLENLTKFATTDGLDSAEIVDVPRFRLAFFFRCL